MNYYLLGLARTYYQIKYNFLWKDVPWAVSQEANEVTLPEGTPRVITPYGDLVGSGEQGFIQLMLDGKLERGRYCTVTPCWRLEKEETNLTRFYFMKLELIDYMCDPAQDAKTMALIAQKFHTDSAIPCKIRQTGENTYDLESMLNIELGSYGVRKYKEHTWMYGTGLALPRATEAQKLHYGQKELIDFEDPFR